MNLNNAQQARRIIDRLLDTKYHLFCGSTLRVVTRQEKAMLEEFRVLYQKLLLTET